jgi:hypothetical protein
MNKAICVHCRHQIDASAKLCPYCGANPVTGERVDTQALVQEVFQSRQLSTGESVMEFARHRQGIVIGVSALALFVLLGILQQWANMRNRTAVANTPAVALTEVADLNNQPEETKQLAMPELPFQFGGKPQSMRTFIVEPGANTPPEVLAAQQAAAAEAQAKAAAAAQAKAAAAAPKPGAAPAVPAGGVARPPAGLAVRPPAGLAPPPAGLAHPPAGLTRPVAAPPQQPQRH